MGSFITKIVMAVLKKFSRVQERTESRQRAYESEGNFSVQAPAWEYILIAVFELLFGGAAFFCVRSGIEIAAGCFIAFCVLGLIAAAFELSFKIQIDGQQIAITRFLRGTKFFTRRQIMSARMDNAGNVTVCIANDTVKYDSTMVNAGLFFEFARSCAFDNLQNCERLSYTIRRNGGEIKILLLALAVFLLLIFFCIKDFSSFSFMEKFIEFPVIAVLFVLTLIYFICLVTGGICVNEADGTFTYKKGFIKNHVKIPQVKSLETKKRFGEEKAFNYILKIEFPSQKTGTLKFSTHDEYSDRFADYLIQELWPEQSDSNEHDDYDEDL